MFELVMVAPTAGVDVTRRSLETGFWCAVSTNPTGNRMTEDGIRYADCNRVPHGDPTAGGNEHESFPSPDRVE